MASVPSVIPEIVSLDSGVSPPMSVPIGLTISEISSTETSAVAGSTLTFEIPQRVNTSFIPKNSYISMLIDLPSNLSIDGSCESLLDSIRIETSSGQCIEECRAFNSISHILWQTLADSGSTNNLAITQGGGSNITDIGFSQNTSTDGKRRAIITMNELSFMSMPRSFPLYLLPSGIRIVLRFVPLAADALFGATGTTASFTISEAKFMCEMIEHTPEYVDSTLKSVATTGLHFVLPECWSSSVQPLSGTASGGTRCLSNIRDPQSVFACIRANTDRAVDKRYISTMKQGYLTRYGWVCGGVRHPASEVRIDTANKDVTEAYMSLMRASGRTGLTSSGTLFNPLKYSYPTKTISFPVTVATAANPAVLTIGIAQTKFLEKYIGTSSIDVTGSGFSAVLNAALVLVSIDTGAGTITTGTDNSAAGLISATSIITLSPTILESGTQFVMGSLLSPTAFESDSENYVKVGPKESIDFTFQSDVTLNDHQLYTHVLHKKVLSITTDGVNCE